MRRIALLRGINVGGRNTVPMAGLRALFEELGFANVSTYIASGNVLFDGPGELTPARLERAIAERFVPARVVLRTPAELRRVVERHPFGADTSTTFVLFLAERPPRAGVAALRERDAGGARVEVAGRDVYVRYPQGLGRAKLTPAVIERHLGAGTMRNWRTVTKLLELV